MQTRLLRARAWLLALLLAFTPIAITQAADARADAEWAAHVDRFLEAHFQANPVAAVYAGRHEFDGRLPDLSAAAIGRNVERLEAERAKTAAFDPASSRRRIGASVRTCLQRSKTICSGPRKRSGRSATRRGTSASSIPRST